MENKASQKQAFFFTIINYIGIAIGVVSTLFIYPKNKELLGIFRYVEAIAQVLYPVMLLGASQALLNFYPKLAPHNRKQLFNYSIVSILMVSFVILALLILGSFLPYVRNMKYVYYAFPIAFFLAFVELFKKQSTIIQRIALPTFFDNIIPKVALPVLFILLLNHTITAPASLLFYIISYGLIFCCTGVYLFLHFKPNFNFSFNGLFSEIPKKSYFRYSLFAFAGSLGSVFAFRIDALMIPKFISMEANGTFSIGVTLASALAVPATGIFILYAPIVSNYIKTENFTELNMKYKEISKLLFFIGALLYSCIFLGIHDLFSLLPTHDNLVASIPVILILGFNVLINMGTGFNGEIITYSSYYKFNLVAIALLIVLNVSLNLLFILYFNFGIVAVAVASLISMVVFNMAKLIFIYKKFRLFPFDMAYLKLVIVFGIVLTTVYFIPEFSSPVMNLMVKTMTCIALNVIIIYKLKLLYQLHFFVGKMVLLLRK
ncbi:MAG TPA: hypothetical protein VF677_03665 [Flavobacterium sp.]|jgi:O-antigen/teichoic acid export membrane protein